MTHILRYAVPIITALITYLYLYIKVDSDAFRKKVLHLHDSLLSDNPAIRKLYVMTLKYQ